MIAYKTNMQKIKSLPLFLAMLIINIGCQQQQINNPRVNRNVNRTITYNKTSNDVEAKVGGFSTPNGKPAQIQYPPERHTRNTTGTDGSGLCVFTSMKHAGDWQEDTLFVKQLEFMRTQRGGGYPEKVNEVLKKASTKYNLQIPPYIQVQDTDIDILKIALKNGYMPCVTYGISPTGRYGGRPIAHMVNLIHGDNDFFGVLDNNYVGESGIEWMTPEEFKKAYITHPDKTGRPVPGNGWAVILLTPSPPPAPKNKG